MPRIADDIVGCSIFLYASEEAARSGARSGGSGFLVHVTSKSNKSRIYLYAVTNRHVLEHSCGVLRLNRKDGGIDTIQTNYFDWFSHPDGDDVAVLPLEIDDTFRWWSVGADLFITQETISAYRIGLGDEAFLIGRLMTHDGRQKNSPVARFGNISLMADRTEPILCDDGRYQEGFLVECRSLSGFSGSPVFITTTQTYEGADAERIGRLRDEQSAAHQSIGVSKTGFRMNSSWISVTGGGPWLLGINWGHMRLPKQRLYKNGDPTDYYADVNTGIACVLPAWRIMGALNRHELSEERKRKDFGLGKDELGGEQSSVTDGKSESDV